MSGVEEVIQSFFNADWSVSYLNVSARQGYQGRSVSESSIISFQADYSAIERGKMVL